MAIEIPIDVDLLKREIKKTYTPEMLARARTAAEELGPEK